eukprot:10957624-Alexandrium_andersonii.AAC.1
MPRQNAHARNHDHSFAAATWPFPRGVLGWPQEGWQERGCFLRSGRLGVRASPDGVFVDLRW